MKKHVKIIGMAVIAVISLIAWGLGAMRPLEAETEVVTQGDLLRTFTVSAQVMPAYTTILNAPATGNVITLPYKSGMEAEGGAVLLTTDTSQEVNADLQKEQLRQQLTSASQAYERLYGVNGEAQSAYAAAESQYLLAQKNYDGGKVMAAEGYLPQLELEKLKSTREVAYQQYLQAKENLSEQRKSYYREQITSYERQLETLEGAFRPGELRMPYGGTVWEVYVEEGSYLSQNEPVMKVYAAGSLKLEASVLAEDAAFLETGIEAEVAYPDGTKSVATVAFIAKTGTKELSSVGIEESRCKVELSTTAIPERMGAGQQVDVKFVTVKAKDVLTVPSTAVVPMGAENVVYVMRDGKAVPTVVEVGESEGGRKEILSGIAKGEHVIADPYEAGVGK